MVKWGIVFAVVLTVFLGTANRIVNATFFGNPKTGLQNISSDAYGYSLFVPEDYNADRLWPLIVVLHDEGGNGGSYIQEWVEEAKKRGLIVFSPTYPLPRDIPEESDKRLLKLIQGLTAEYEIDPKKVLVTGSGFGGHYAFYLALHYPSFFSATASIGNGADGPFAKVFKTARAESNRLPLLIVTSTTDTTVDASKNSAIAKLEEKGYQLEKIKIEGNPALNAPEIKAEVLDWFSRTTEKEEVGRKGATNAKQKFLSLIDRTYKIQ